MVVGITELYGRDALKKLAADSDTGSIRPATLLTLFLTPHTTVKDPYLSCSQQIPHLSKFNTKLIRAPSSETVVSQLRFHLDGTWSNLILKSYILLLPFDQPLSHVAWLCY